MTNNEYDLIVIGAGELIAPVVYAMRFGLTVKRMAGAMLPYPTMAEAVRRAAAQF